MNKYNSIQIILRVFYRKKWYVKVQIVANFKRVKILFFVNKKMINILCKNFEMFIINCIYKINKYDMFLLNIVDHIFINIIFYIDFAFVWTKKKIYRWMLQQLKKLYKIFDFSNSIVIVIDRDETLINVLKIEYFEIITLFCLFHVNKNVRVWCKFEFDENEKNLIFFMRFTNVWYMFTINLHIERFCMISKMRIIVIFRIFTNIVTITFETIESFFFSQ